MHVRALMKGVKSVKRYGMEGSEMRLRGDAGFANEANLPTAGSGQRPCPFPPPPLGQQKKGGNEIGGGRGGGREGLGGRGRGR